MKITQTTKYAIRSALYLARSGGTVCSAEIAYNTGIPQSYLLRVLSQGVKAGIFGVAQGVQGGFCIKRQPEDISMLDLLLMSQGKLEICKQEKAAYGGTPVSDDCPMLDHVCGGLQRVIEAICAPSQSKIWLTGQKPCRGTPACAAFPFPTATA